MQDPSVLEVGLLSVAPQVREVTLASKPLALTRLELDLLIALAEPSPRPMTRENLLEGCGVEAPASVRTRWKP
jgi:DNA-binding response OmpR family regulator